MSCMCLVLIPARGREQHPDVSRQMSGSCPRQPGNVVRAVHSDRISARVLD